MDIGGEGHWINTEEIEEVAGESEVWASLLNLLSP